MPGSYSTVSSGTELLEQLANTSARYIRVMGDLRVPANLGYARVMVNRCVRTTKMAQLVVAEPPGVSLCLSISVDVDAQWHVHCRIVPFS